MIRDVTEQEFWKLMEDALHRSVCWDIETGPQEEDELKKEFKEDQIDLPKHPGEFDRSEVKLGGLVDPQKIQAKITKAFTEHNTKVQKWTIDCEIAKRSAWETFVDKAPLSAVYGRVLAIGYGVTDGHDLAVWLDIGYDEYLLLTHFWRVVANLRRRGNDALLIAHNGNGFDIPFVTRRGWKHDLRPPRQPHLIIKNRWTPDWVVDTLKVWSCGDYREFIKLDVLAKMFGVQGKLAGVTGDMFWKLMRDGQMDVANEYLKSDIVALYGVARKMGII